MKSHPMAADTEKLVESTARERGVVVAAPPERLPGAQAHALNAAETRTLCGRDVAGLFRFGAMTYEHTNPLLRCMDCDRAAG